MQKLQFSLDISAQKYLSYYQGVVQSVYVETDSGYSINFPASELKKFVTHSGIQGRFEIEFNDQHKLVSLIRL